jgi:hypothetical protein
MGRGVGGGLDHSVGALQALQFLVHAHGWLLKIAAVAIISVAAQL